ncbi:poly(3-hydroxyalkanoate) depolymerase [Pseudonocardia sp. TMWB2A]|uniref:alpha/beta fold hydrolase n=1 Tax=Pseudonocardia sp. TMWB2A TaxID=687430 RepID=UPI00307CC8A6
MTGDVGAPRAIEQRVRIHGLDVHVSVRPGPGDATPLLLLMGVGGNSEMWHPVRDMIGATRTTVSFDVPGTGRSATPPIPLHLGLIATIATRVLDLAGVERADVMGVSWGGLLAQHLAIVHRRRVRRVVLANTHYGLGGIPASPKALATLMSVRRFRDSQAFTEALASFGGTADGRSIPEALRGHVAARLACPPTARGYLFQMLSISTWSSLPFLPLLRRPTLMLAGGADPAVPAVNARIMNALVPDSELVVVPDGGHLMLFERADELVPVVERFLGPDTRNPHG